MAEEGKPEERRATGRRGAGRRPPGPRGPVDGDSNQGPWEDVIPPFPILTEEISFPAAPSRPASGAPGAAPLGQVVEGALREVLGWRPRADDPRGFLGALSQSFALREVEGHTEWSWTPRTYAVQTDLAGGITGAQASLYARAQDALDRSLPLLEGLRPLRLDADPQDLEALRAVIRSQMTELVNELGVAGGPRVPRVEQLFLLLLGPELDALPDPDRVGGHLERLRREFGFRSAPLFVDERGNAVDAYVIDESDGRFVGLGRDGERVAIARGPGGMPVVTEEGDLANTVEEEQNLTNFRILADYLTGVRVSWIANRRFFARPAKQPFFGTHLVLLSRQLSVVAESVDEVRFAMDSVFIGPAERQTLEIVIAGGIVIAGDEEVANAGQAALVPMFIEELLSWVEKFASEEGPSLIVDGGKFAVHDAFLPVAARLRDLVTGAIEPDNHDELPRGYRTLRVRRALEELAGQLDELVRLARPIRHPIPSQR